MKRFLDQLRNCIRCNKFVLSWFFASVSKDIASSLVHAKDLTRGPNENISTTFEKEKEGIIPKLLDEIRFFRSYAHHIAISDSCREMLRDV